MEIPMHYTTEALARFPFNDTFWSHVGHLSGVSDNEQLNQLDEEETHLRLAKSNDDARRNFVRDRGLVQLVTLLENGADEVKEKTAVSLAILAGSNDDIRHAIADQGVIRPLMTLLQNGSYRQTLYAADLLKILSSGSDTVRSAIACCITKGALAGPFSTLLQDGSGEQKEKILAVLVNLARGTDDIRSQWELTRPLKSLLQNGTDVQKLYAAIVLAKFSPLTAEVVQGVISLLRTEPYDLRQRAFEMLASGSKNNLWWMEETGGVLFLAALLQAGTYAQRYHALNQLMVFPFDVTDEQEFVRNGGIDLLIALLQFGTDRQKANALDVVAKLAINDGIGATILQHQGVAPLVVFAESGNAEEKRLASTILRTLAGLNDELRNEIACEGGDAFLRSLLPAEAQDECAQTDEESVAATDDAPIEPSAVIPNSRAQLDEHKSFSVRTPREG